MALVRAARARREPLYPQSTGLNWGYGSSMPLIDGGSIVDLSGMRSVRNIENIDLTHPVAVIEPGVTQGQLHTELHARCPALTFNVTGAACETSIIGNSLDRGVGYFGPRHDDLFGLEVVTGAGEVLHTGFRRLGEASPLSFTHPHGLGPMLDGLFLQSNFGIVTSACFRLGLRQPVEIALSLSLRDDARLGEFIDSLAAAKQAELLTSVTHIGNRARTLSTLTAGVVEYLQGRCGLPANMARAQAHQALSLFVPGEWSALAAVTGTARMVRAVVAELRQGLGRLARITVVTKSRLDLAFAAADSLRELRLPRHAAAVFSAIRPLHGLALGIPTDAPVHGLLWQFGAVHLDPTQLDQSPCGLLYVCPAMPMEGHFVQSALQAFADISSAHQMPLYITVNIETRTSLVAVMNLLFERNDPTQVIAAHRCAEALHQQIHRLGLEVYRARSDSMGLVTKRNPEYWAQVRRLKLALDPDDIIAPGRYCPIG